MSTVVHSAVANVSTPARSLRLDAALSGTSGAVLLAGAPLLDGVLGAPAALLASLGALFLVYAGVLLLLARAGAPNAGVLAVVAANMLWAAASVAVVATDALTLTSAGNAVALAQAVAVAGIAALQLAAVRR